MQEQNFKKHARYVPGFHFLTSGIITIVLIIAVVLLISTRFSLSSVFDLLVAISLGLLFFYIRQFSTGKQDRIIRAEENFRSYRLTGKALDQRLTKSQVIALRFASDEEFPVLSEKAIEENMEPSNIKKAVQQWRADHHRV
jgi:hypothetical protein